MAEGVGDSNPHSCESPVCKGCCHAETILSANPDGRRVLTASRDSTARLWEADSGKLLATFQGHAGSVRSAVFSQSLARTAGRVLTASIDNTARLWKADNGKGDELCRCQLNRCKARFYCRRIPT